MGGSVCSCGRPHSRARVGHRRSRWLTRGWQSLWTKTLVGSHLDGAVRRDTEEIHVQRQVFEARRGKTRCLEQRAMSQRSAREYDATYDDEGEGRLLLVS